MTHMFELFNVKQVIEDMKASKTTEATCHTCKFGMSLLQHFVEFGRSQDQLARLSNNICVSLRIESPRVCKGISDIFKEELATVIAQVTLSPTEICGIILGESCAHVSNPLHNWTLPLTPFPKPPLRPIPDASNSTMKPIKILQLSDTHIDMLYQEGKDAKCGEPLCCRAGSLRELKKKTIPDHDLSGFWGDYRDCDIPLRTLEALMVDIKEKHPDIDAVLWTGDIPAHDVWNQTESGQKHLIREVSSLLDKYFGHINILPSLGNHESAPVNSFPQPEVEGKISWLYDDLQDIWSKWLPSGTVDHIRKGAYYSTYLKKGLKVISINTNYCNNQNWWLLLNSTDPADELSWMIKELQESELNGDRVMIIGHIPPGYNDCLQVWSRNYHRIINRFEDTIVGQFFGHTHQDEFEIFYDEDDKTGKGLNSTHFAFLRPTSVAFISPSVTTFGGVNPGYRIYSMDAETFSLVDHETYFVNLTKANESGDRVKLSSEVGYRAKQDLGMTSLHPTQFHVLTLKLLQDNVLFKKFEKNYFNQSNRATHCRSHDWICKTDLLCRLISAKSHDYSICHKLIKDFNLMSQ